MKIALLYLNKGGGIANCTYEIAKILSRNQDVICYLSSENRLLQKFESLPCITRVYNWSRGQKSLLAAMLKKSDTTGIAKDILESNPDIVIDTGSWWWRGVVFTGLKNKLPIAEIVHDPTPHPGTMRLFYILHHKLFPSRADIVIALSDYCYRELVNKYPSKYHIRSKHGIIISSEDVDVDGVASKRNKMLFFGLIEPYKGVDILVDAYKIAKASKPELELTIAGRGRLDPSVLSKIKEYNISLINEYIPESDIQQLITSHGVMILPYTYATQSGVAAVALANGMPCVATNVGALPEQVQNERNGLIVPPNNPEELAGAMIKIASDYNLAKNMSEESFRIGKEEYSWDRIGVELLSDLETAITKIKLDRKQ